MSFEELVKIVIERHEANVKKIEFDMLKDIYMENGGISENYFDSIMNEKTYDDSISTKISSLCDGSRGDHIQLQIVSNDLFDEGKPSIERNNSTQTRTIDLHGYTAKGARQMMFRVFQSLNRKCDNLLKINVGKGIHSQGGPVIKRTVMCICADLGFPTPSESRANSGYLRLFIPSLANPELGKTGS